MTALRVAAGGMGVLLALGLAPSLGEAGPLERLERALRTTKDVRAKIVQVRRSPLGGEPQTAHGRLLLRRPGDVRLEYDTPEPLVLLRRGDTAWVYVPKLEQAQRIPAARAGIPLDWVLGGDLATLRESATLTAVDGGVGIVWKKPLAGRWKRARLAFGEAVFPELFVLEDTSGEIVEIRLEGLRTNRGLPEERFAPQWPPGTRIVELGS